MRSILLAAALTLSIGCGQGPQGAGEAKPSAAGPQIEKAVLGEWVTVATSAGHYDGVMHLNANGTWREEDKFRKGGTVQKVDGTFTFKSGASGDVVAMTVQKVDGKAVPPGAPAIDLNFDRKEQVLSNPFPGVVYARRADAARIKKQFERTTEQ